jgi:hypothetical protein
VDFFNLPNPFSRTLALGSTQPLTGMSIRNLPGRKKGLAHVAVTTLPPSMSRMSENVGASTSRSPKGLHGLYRGNFTFTVLLTQVYFLSKSDLSNITSNSLIIVILLLTYVFYS